MARSPRSRSSARFLPRSPMSGRSCAMSGGYRNGSSRRSKSSAPQARPSHSGVVRCGKCGRAYIGMSARGNGGRYEYYSCTGRQKYGPQVCRRERLPGAKLEQAVLRQLGDVYRDGALIRSGSRRSDRVLAEAEPPRAKGAPPPADRRAPRKRKERDPADLPRRQPEVCGTSEKVGASRTRTDDLLGAWVRSRRSALFCGSPRSCGRTGGGSLR
jgi:hypothetical protein